MCTSYCAQSSPLTAETVELVIETDAICVLFCWPPAERHELTSCLGVDDVSYWSLDSFT